MRALHYRPPFGLMLPSQARFVAELGYTSVLGDVYPEDTQRPGVARILSRVMPRLNAGSILILHDGSPIARQDRSQTLAAVELILQAIANRGLRAVTVAELLADSDVPRAHAAASAGRDRRC